MLWRQKRKDVDGPGEFQNLEGIICKLALGTYVYNYT